MKADKIKEWFSSFMGLSLIFWLVLMYGQSGKEEPIRWWIYFGLGVYAAWAFSAMWLTLREDKDGKLTNNVSIGGFFAWILVGIILVIEFSLIQCQVRYINDVFP